MSGFKEVLRVLAPKFKRTRSFLGARRCGARCATGSTVARGDTSCGSSRRRAACCRSPGTRTFPWRTRPSARTITSPTSRPCTASSGWAEPASSCPSSERRRHGCWLSQRTARARIGNGTVGSVLLAESSSRAATRRPRRHPVLGVTHEPSFVLPDLPRP